MQIDEAEQLELYDLIFQKIADAQELLEHTRNLVQELEDEWAAEDVWNADGGAQIADP